MTDISGEYDSTNSKKRRFFPISRKLEILDQFHSGLKVKEILNYNKINRIHLISWLKKEDQLRNFSKKQKKTLHSGPTPKIYNNEFKILDFISYKNINGESISTLDILDFAVKIIPELNVINKKLVIAWLYRFIKRNNILFEFFSANEVGNEYINQSFYKNKLKILRNRKKCAENVEGKLFTKENFTYDLSKFNCVFIDEINLKFFLIKEALENNKNMWVISKNFENFNSALEISKNSKNNRFDFTKNFKTVGIKVLYLYDISKKNIFPISFYKNQIIQNNYCGYKLNQISLENYFKNEIINLNICDYENVKKKLFLANFSKSENFSKKKLDVVLENKLFEDQEILYVKNYENSKSEDINIKNNFKYIENHLFDLKNNITITLKKNLENLLIHEDSNFDNINVEKKIIVSILKILSDIVI